MPLLEAYLILVQKTTHDRAHRGFERRGQAFGVSGTYWLDALELLWLDRNGQFSRSHMHYEQVAFMCL